MRIYPINMFNTVNVKNNQNSQRYNSSVKNTVFGSDSFQFKGRMFNTEEAARIGEALVPLREFMAETRPLYVKVLNLKKNVGELLSKNGGVIDYTRINKEKAAAVVDSADHFLNLIPYKKTTTIAAEADAHIARINEGKLMDLPEQEIMDLQKKTVEINEKINALEKDKKNFPLINEDVNNFLEVNKNLENVLFS